MKLELSKLLAREAEEEQADEIFAFARMCVVVPLDAVFALRAAELCRTRKLVTADVIVYATAV